MQILKCKTFTLKNWKQAQLLAIMGITLVIPMTALSQTEPSPSSNSNSIRFVYSSDGLSLAQLEDRKTAWQKTLSAIAKKEDAALFFDIDLHTLPPQAVYEHP